MIGGLDPFSYCLRCPADRSWIATRVQQRCGRGNSIDEALQGLLELVERDSVALWVVFHARIGRASTSTQSMIPACGCYSAPARPKRVAKPGYSILPPTSASPQWPRLLHPKGPGAHGFIAHVDPAIAVVRALTEVCQSESGISGLERRESTPEGVPEIEGGGSPR